MLKAIATVNNRCELWYLNGSKEMISGNRRYSSDGKTVWRLEKKTYTYCVTFLDTGIIFSISMLAISFNLICLYVCQYVCILLIL